MVELVGVHRFDDADLIHHFTEMREHLGKFRPGLSILGERKLWPQNTGIRFDKCKSLFSHNGFGQRLSFELLQLRFVIKQIQLTGRARHEQVNDAFGFWRKVRWFGSKRIFIRCGSMQTLRFQQGCQRHRTQPHTTVLKKVTPCSMPESVLIALNGLIRRHDL